MHRCIEGTNEAIARHNQRLVTHRAEDGADGQPVDVPVIATESQDSLDGPMSVIARFCPFCGERLRGGKEGYAMRDRTHRMAQRLDQQAARLSDRPAPTEIEGIRSAARNLWLMIDQDYTAERLGVELPEGGESDG